MKGARPFTDEEFEQILQTLAGPTELRDRALVTVGVKTGFRINELLSLRVSDVFRHNVIVHTLSVARRNMKRKREGRSVPLNETARTAILPLVKHLQAIPQYPGDKHCYLFASLQNLSKPITVRHALRIVHRARDQLQLDGHISTHSWRKTFAKNVHNQLGKNLLDTSRALGHKSVSSTQSYIASNDEVVTDAILKL